MHLHEEQYYLVSNNAVARNTLFSDPGIQSYFKRKMDYNLNSICDILAYNFKDHEFQILVKLKKRESFIQFYREKHNDIEGFINTPESTYIFSQQMANLQVGLVKKFNYKYNRKGTLMAGRFKRRLLINADEIIETIQSLNNGNQINRYSGIWAECAMKRIEAKTSKWLYRAMEKDNEKGREGFWNEFKSDLVGNIVHPLKIFNYPPYLFLNDKVFRSICRFRE